MAISYPAGLPLALRDGYEFTETNNIVRTPMQSGQARQRVEFQTAPDLLKLKWLLTAQESALFGTWARNVVGAGWFTMRIVTPLGFDDVEMRFTQRISGPVLMGKYDWQWSGVCELRETPEIDPGWALLPDYWLHPEIFDLAMNREWSLNPWQTYITVADTAINEDWPTP